MNIKKILPLTAILMVTFFSPLMVIAQTEVPKDFGAKGALLDQSITTDEALIYAIEDEYLAQARYDAILNKFGAIQPFKNIKTAELRHIEALKRLFGKYSIQIPKDEAGQYTTTPNTITEALEAGISGEIDNIAMYNKFISNPTIPSDIKKVMTNLRNASINHLAAFKSAIDQQ